MEQSISTLFSECVRRLHVWPSLRARRYPTLPKHCSLVIAAPNDGKYKLDIKGTKFTHADYIKERDRQRGLDKRNAPDVLSDPSYVLPVRAKSVLKINGHGGTIDIHIEKGEDILAALRAFAPGFHDHERALRDMGTK